MGKITLEVDTDTLSEVGAEALAALINDICDKGTAEPTEGDLIAKLTRFYNLISNEPRQKDMADFMLSKCWGEGVSVTLKELVEVTGSDNGGGVAGVRSCITRNFRKAMDDRRVVLFEDISTEEYGMRAKYAEPLAEIAAAYDKNKKARTSKLS